MPKTGLDRVKPEKGGPLSMRKIKKYANRKLYDTVDKQYISMEQLAALVRAGESVSVLDNQTGEDITVQILSQLLSKDRKRQDSEMISDMLSQMLRRGSTTLADYARRTTSRWQEAVHVAEEEIERIACQLYKELPEGVVSKRKEEVKQTIGKVKEWISDKVDQRVNDMMGMMNVASRDQMDGLSKEMRALAGRLDEIEKLLKNKPLEEPGNG
jgi:polyhydroxyalkanoate synthesis repressor PhaR